MCVCVKEKNKKMMKVHWKFFATVIVVTTETSQGAKAFHIVPQAFITFGSHILEKGEAGRKTAHQWLSLSGT